MSNKNLIKKVILIFVALALLAFFTACKDVEQPVNPVYKTGIPDDKYSTSLFETIFPYEYKLYRATADSSLATMTEFGGAVPFMKNDNVHELPEGYRNAQPYLKNLWLGYPFSYEYREARGHTNAIDDILDIDRLNRYGEKAGLPGTCWNCKTTKMPTWLEEHGDAFWSMDFNQFRDAANSDPHNESIGCAFCHNPSDMELRIISVPLDEALKEQGIDWREASRNDMRSYVCGQCHVEYYFGEAIFGPDKKPIFPWDGGYSAEAMYEYYKGEGRPSGPNVQKGFEGQFFDFIHPVSQVPVLKAQHPEFEFWSDSVHGESGVTCADCHMEYVRIDGKKKIANHHLRSPLKNIEGSCMQCHSDKTPEFLEGRVLDSQHKVFNQLLIAQANSVKAHEAIRLAREFYGHNEEDLIQAKEYARKGQFFWDLVSAENSVGFHNTTKALDILAKSQQASLKAVEAASKATNWQIARFVEGDIYEIVPPILQHSRKLQMDPQHMASHKWLTYLPVNPQAEQVWDGQVRLLPSNG